MISPVRDASHADPHFVINGWLALYGFGLKGVRGKVAATLKIDQETDVQPDAMLLLSPEFGGGTWTDEQDLLHGTPELIVEITGDSEGVDAVTKRKLYHRFGVQEYLLWIASEDRIVWESLVDGEYQELPIDESGVIRSQVFPGLWLNEPALLAGDTAALMATLALGLRSSEHRKFAGRFAGS